MHAPALARADLNPLSDRVCVSVCVDARHRPREQWERTSRLSFERHPESRRVQGRPSSPSPRSLLSSGRTRGESRRVAAVGGEAEEEAEKLRRRPREGQGRGVTEEREKERTARYLEQDFKGDRREERGGRRGRSGERGVEP